MTLSRTNSTGQRKRASRKGPRRLIYRGIPRRDKQTDKDTAQMTRPLGTSKQQQGSALLHPGHLKSTQFLAFSITSPHRVPRGLSRGQQLFPAHPADHVFPLVWSGQHRAAGPKASLARAENAVPDADAGGAVRCPGRCLRNIH
jgi:hypothetical protein